MKLVSVDVWDTLLRRNCHPDAIKIKAAEELYRMAGQSLNEIDKIKALRKRQEVEANIAALNVERGKDPEYLLCEVHREVIQASPLLKECLGEKIDTVVERLCDYEVSLEKECTYPDPSIFSLIEQYSPDCVIFVSDFYMSSSQLQDILVHNGIDYIDFERSVSSADVCLNKASGRLFDKIREMNRPDWHLHIGDNQHSDVEVPRSRAIEAIHFIPKKQHAQRKQLEKEFNNWLRKYEVVKKPTKPSHIPSVPALSRGDSAHELGKKMAPFFSAFASYILQKAKELEVGKVYFFTREGILFEQVFRAFCDRQNQKMASEVLEVSRVATFFPSLSSVDTKQLMRLWTQYSTQSMGALFKSLDLDISSFHSALQRHCLDADTPILYPWQNESVVSFLNDPKVATLIEKERLRRRELLTGYLASKGMRNDGKKYLIVDIGWRGSIQDNLAHILGDSVVHGVYFGLNEFLNPQPCNSHKYALGPNLNDSLNNYPLLRFVSPLEMLCNAPIGSVRGYRSSNDGYLTEHEDNSDELRVYETFTHDFQRGVLDKVGLYDIASSEDELALRGFFVKCWYNILNNPPYVFANSFYGLSHNETFGVGGFVDKKTVGSISYLSILSTPFSEKSRVAVKHYLDSVDWPQGRLLSRGVALSDKIKINLVLKIFNVRARLRAIFK